MRERLLLLLAVGFIGLVFALLPAQEGNHITGELSFLRTTENIGKIDIEGNFVSNKDIRLINYAINGKKEEKNCGLHNGCPDCLFNDCFTGSIYKVNTEEGRVWVMNYHSKFRALRKVGYCYIFMDEQKLIKHENIYDIVYERPIAGHGWQARTMAEKIMDKKKGVDKKEWQGWRLFSWRNISAPPYECISAGILHKWQAVPSLRQAEIEKALEAESKLRGIEIEDAKPEGFGLEIPEPPGPGDQSFDEFADDALLDEFIE